MIKNRSSKYGAIPKTHNGVKYHSKLEQEYARDLDLMIKAGEIKRWDRQVRFDLYAYGKKITSYYIDFKITHLDNSVEYVEVKGFETKDWRLKFNMFVACVDDTDPGTKITITPTNPKFAARFRPVAPHKLTGKKPLPRRY